LNNSAISLQNLNKPTCCNRWVDCRKILETGSRNGYNSCLRYLFNSAI